MNSRQLGTNPNTNQHSPQPSFFAVIPADVRYSRQLCANAKLLYGEITALTNKEGYCWATNEYFADLYGVSQRSIQNWLEDLKNAGFIEVESSNVSGKSQRKICLPTNSKKEAPRRNLQGGTKISSPPLILHNKTNTLSQEKPEREVEFEEKEKVSDDLAQDIAIKAAEHGIMSCNECLNLIKSYGIQSVKDQLAKYFELSPRSKSLIVSPYAIIITNLRRERDGCCSSE